MKICIFERSNEKSHFSKTKIYFRKKTTPQLLEHIGQQNMKVGEKTNFGRLATIFQICSMDADILSKKSGLYNKPFHSNAVVEAIIYEYVLLPRLFSRRN